MVPNYTFHRLKILMVFAACLAGFAVLAGRLGYLMIARSAHYTSLAQELHERERSIKAARGRILDRNGTVIADNRTVCTVSVIHSQITEPERVIEVLSESLGLSRDEVREKVEKISSREVIRSNVAGDTVEEYTVEITRIFPQNGEDTRNLMLKVTDERLLEATGGIVQGMSGSPILQDGKLVGAVTHVLVNSPDQGYGILAENMLEIGWEAKDI